MKKAHARKEAVINQLRDRLLNSQVIVLTEYRGLTVQDMNLLRAKCRKAGVEYRVAKNSLTRLAIKDTELEGLEPYLVGPTAIGMGFLDSASAAKIFVESAGEYAPLKIKAGVLKKHIFGPEKVRELARLAPKEVLISQLLANMKGPITNLGNVLSGPLGGLINLLKALQEQKAEE